MNFDALSEYYFTDLILLVCNILAFVTAIKKRKSSSQFLIKIYVHVSLAINILLYFGPIFLEQETTSIKFISDIIYFYIIIECAIIFMYLYKKTESVKLKKYFTTFFAVFAIFWLYILLWHANIISGAIKPLAGLESFTISLFCILSLQFKIKKTSISSFMNSSDAYILIGTLAYFSFSIPIFFTTLVLSFIAPNIMLAFQCLNLLACGLYFLIIRKGLYANSEN